MPISVITNFEVNTYQPIDTRLVATNSAALSEIKFPYDGLTVYTKEQNLNYTYAGAVSGWQVSSNGIYGGSGSIVGDTDVNMGSVGSSTNDKSYELILSASSSQDRVQYATSFIRNNATDDYDTIEVKNQVRFLDNTRGLINGPYISYNKNDSKKGIISFGTPDKNLSTTVERLRIEPDSTNNNGAIVMIPSTSSMPMYFSQNSTYNTFIGYNWNGAQQYITGTSSSIISFLNGEISFLNVDNVGTSFIKQLSIGEPNSNQSVVKIRVDTSAYDAGGTNGNRFFELKTVPDIIRNIEHKYTKTQYLGYKKLENFLDAGDVVTMKIALLSTFDVLITGDGNFFDFELPVGTAINRIFDIKIIRLGSDGYASADNVPAGTEIKIRFTYESTPGNFPTRIILWQEPSHSNGTPPRKIKSSYADTNGGEYITILHNTGSTDLAEKNEKVAGDIITFTKGGDDYWYVTNVNREKQLLKSITSTVTWYSLSSSSGSIMTIQSPVRRIKYPTPVGLGYYWLDDGNVSFIAAEPAPTGPIPSTVLDHPFKQKYGSGGSQYFQYQDVNIDVNPRFIIGKNSVGIVYLKGSFRLTMPAASLNKSYEYGIGNKFHIANIKDTTWYVQVAQDDTAIETTIHNTRWGYCEVIVRSDNANGMPLSQGSGALVLPGRISVDTSGRVFLQFQLNFFAGLASLLGNYTIDVNVPEFSYSTT